MSTTTVAIQELKLPQLKIVAEMYGITKDNLNGSAAKKQTWLDAITAAVKQEAAKPEETAPPSDTLFDPSAYTAPVRHTDWADSIDVEGEDIADFLPRHSVNGGVSQRPDVPPPTQPEPEPEPELEPEEEDEGKLYGWDYRLFGNQLTVEQAAFRFNVDDVVCAGGHRPRQVGRIIKFTTCNGYPNMPLVQCEDGIERFLPPQLMELLPFGQLELPLGLDCFDAESDWDSSVERAIAVMERDCDRSDRETASMLVNECDREMQQGPIAEPETIDSEAVEEIGASALRDRQGRENECDRIMDESLAKALILDGFYPVVKDEEEKEEPIWEECVGDHAFIAIYIDNLVEVDAYGNIYYREYRDGELDETEFERVKNLVITNQQLPVTKTNLPIINYQLPITKTSSLTTNYSSPIINYQLPITKTSSLTTNYSSPITHYQLPITHLLRDPPVGVTVQMN